jgi:vitamin B12 transporter
LSVSAARADDGPAQETIVVTASRIPQDIRTVGSSVSVITSQDIAQFQERFVLDALTAVPGLDSAQNGPRGGTASIFMRGADSYQTMVLIDGVPVNDPSGPESAFDFGRLMSADIQRIEVLRGPQSTLYGGDAVGGVVNIITSRKTDGFNASALAEGGSYGTRTFAGNIAGGTEKFGGYLNVTQYNSDGFPAADEKFGNRLADGLNTTQVTGGGHLTPSDWLSIDLALRSADSEAGYAGSNFLLGRPVDAPNESRTHERSGRLAATTSFLDGDLTGVASMTESTTRRNLLDSQFGDSVFDGERRKAEYVESGKILNGLTFVGGLSWQEDLAHTSYDVPHETITRAIFGELQAQPITDLYLTAGGRMDDHSTFGDFDTYRITAAYFIDGIGAKLHGAVGTGFRAPSLYELFDSFSGNPKLQPETSQGWEAGIDQKIGSTLTVKATYFDQKINNRIDFNPVTFVSFNNGHTTAQGVELEADFSPISSVNIRAVYTYDRTKDLATGQELLRRPQNAGSLMAAWQATDALSLTAKLRGVGDRLDSGGHVLAAYATADLGAQYAVTPQLTIEARIINISDTRYEEVYGYGTPRRSAYGGVAFKY